MSDMLTRLERMEGKIERALTIVEAHQAASTEQHKALAEKVDDINVKTCLLKRAMVGDLEEPEKKGLLERMSDAEDAIGEMKPDVEKVKRHDLILRCVAWVTGALSLAVLARAGDNLWEWWTKRGG